jgi:hypothetical protein
MFPHLLGHHQVSVSVKVLNLHPIWIHIMGCLFVLYNIALVTRHSGLCKDIHVTGRGGLYGCERSRLPHFLAVDSQMAVRLSALRVGRPLAPRKIPGTYFS